MLNIVIVSYDFCIQNIRLQPWRYVYEIARRLPEHGWSSVILTDSYVNGKDDLGVAIRDSFPLSPFKGRSMSRAISDISPDVVLWPLGPKSIAYVPIFRKLSTKMIGYLPGPILNMADFFAACRAKLFSESLLAASWLFARALQWGEIMASCCESFIVLSEANRKSMIRMGIGEHSIHLITAGRDQHEKHPGEVEPTNFSNKSGANNKEKKTALFMGWPTRVRGIELLLDAFKIVSKQYGNLALKILARGEDTENHTRLHHLVSEHPARERIAVIDGLLSKEDVSRHIWECDFGVLPFIQASADRPLSFLEFFAAGKPVVSTNASGISELISDNRGIIANRVDPESLAGALLRIAAIDIDDYKKYQDACLSFVDEYPVWDDVIVQLASMLNKN